MKPITRSISGAVLMLAIIPAIIGILACMPVPIGDPERSRIDPEISGVWVWLDGDDDAFYAFEPYDKRTWLLTGVPVEAGEAVDLANYDLETYAGLTELIGNVAVGDDGVTATEVALYKAWLTKLGGVWFMTWEPKAVFDNESFLPELWFVFRLDRPDENTLNLTLLDDDLFDGVAETRRAYERVIKKNAKNEKLYVDDDPIRLYRVKPEHLDFFEDLAGEVIEYQGL